MIKAAAQNYTATVANISADDPNRASKIEKNRIRVEKKIAGYDEEIKARALTCESEFKTDMDDFAERFKVCLDP